MYVVKFHENIFRDIDVSSPLRIFFPPDQRNMEHVCTISERFLPYLLEHLPFKLNVREKAIMYLDQTNQEIHCCERYQSPDV